MQLGAGCQLGATLGNMFYVMYYIRLDAVRCRLSIRCNFGQHVLCHRGTNLLGNYPKALKSVY